ncbi:MAG: 5'-nucleotidase C-terminal domain-containing protein [Rhodobacteraceae bacterium]|nr:5'-nucleotidase C-terminal domain-containing protein [Paracoccaceae bacterium]
MGTGAKLRLLCTTDLHGALWPHDYAAGTADTSRGLAMLAPLIEAARDERPDACLFDVGDMLQGTALTDTAAASSAKGPHPVIAAMNLLGYDAGCFGNHDFDYGLELAERAAADARFPLLCANLLRRPPGDGAPRPVGAPIAFVDREVTDASGRKHPLRLGIVAVVPPQTVMWNAAALLGALQARDAVEAVEDAIPALRAGGADLIVVLCHSGLGDGRATPMAEDVGRRLAKLNDVDVLLAGHSHCHLPGRDFRGVPDVDAERGLVHGKPALMAGYNGRHLGLLDLELARGDRGWTITGSEARLLPARDAGVLPSPAILSACRAAHDRTLKRLDQVLATTAAPLHGIFAMIGHAPALRLLAEAQRWRAAQLVPGTPMERLPILSAVAPFRLGGRGGPNAFVDIPVGEIRERHLLDITPFPNRLTVFEINGRQLRDWLERAVAGFATVPRGGRDANLLVPAAPAYNLDTIYGAQFSIDLSAAPRFDPIHGTPLPGKGHGRIRDLSVRGRMVTSRQRFAMATNAYRASGGGGFRMLHADSPKLSSGETLRQTLAAHLRALGVVVPDPTPAWQFAPLGATAVFDSAPQAEIGVHVAANAGLTDLGLTPDGYRRFRLAL